MKRILLPLLLCLGARGALCQAHPLTLVRYHDVAGRFTIGVPAAWVPTDQALVDQVAGQMNSLTGAGMPRMAGFETLSGEPSRLLLLGAMHDTTVTELRVAREAVGPQGAADLDRTIAHVNAGLGSAVHVGAMTWDPREHLIWLNAGDEGTGSSAVRMLVVMRPVEHWGTVLVLVMGGGATEAELRGLMLTMVHTLAIDGRTPAR